MSHNKKLSATLNVLEAAMEMICDRCRSTLVVNEAEQLVGILSLEDINRTFSLWQNYPISDAEIPSNLSSQTLIEICTTEILYAWPDEPLSEALDRMALRGLHQLPVVARDNHERILGLLEWEQITLTCNLAITHKALQHYLPVRTITDYS